MLQLYLRLNMTQNMERTQNIKSKQTLQNLPVEFAQVKEGNKSENLLNEIRQIIYSLYQAKLITKKSM